MTTAEITPFAFDDSLVRVVMRDGEPWFVAKDVARALSITWSGSKILERIKDEWKGVVNFTTPSGDQNVILINEPAVYKLAFRSNKPEAERFSDWVAAEVLPSIRKTGSYARPEIEAEPIGQSDLEERLALEKVRETRRTYGVKAAQAMWRKLGLTYVAEMGGSFALAENAPESVMRFIEEGVDDAPGLSTPAAAFWKAFCTFCEAHQLHNPGREVFSVRFGRHGFVKRLVGGRSVFFNIRPRPVNSAGDQA